jgi:hypothetical protein
MPRDMVKGRERKFITQPVWWWEEQSKYFCPFSVGHLQGTDMSFRFK